MSQVRVEDALKQWRGWSSGSIDELAAVGTAFVWALGLEPLPETTASDRINRRTIRYYISNGTMDPPEGERRLATYDYRHLLQLLYIKARQHAGDRLDEIRAELDRNREHRLETLVIRALPEIVPPPIPADPTEFARPADLAAVLRRWAFLTGRVGRYQGRLTETRLLNVVEESIYTHAPVDQPGMQLRMEIGIENGVTLTLPADHPLVHDEDGRKLILRGIRRLLHNYRHGGGPAGEED